MYELTITVYWYDSEGEYFESRRKVIGGESELRKSMRNLNRALPENATVYFVHVVSTEPKTVSLN